ncbi:MAG: site-specific DNA-methyltransferase [Deltaproteobacteria bacterium]
MAACPNNLEELQELEKLIPLCRLSLYNQAKSRIQAGVAKSVSEASRQLAEETGKSVNTIRSAINRAIGTDAVHQLSELSGTDKHRPIDRIALGEKEILEIAHEIQAEKREIKQELINQRKEAIETTLKSEIRNIPKVQCTNAIDFLSDIKDNSIDLLITDPPYSTDVDDILAFAQSWLPAALNKVKDTGFAFVFIGAYPEEVKAYLNIETPTQMLVWEYKNTLGQNPKERYKLNYQAILFYRMKNSGDLNIDLTSEQWAVQSINAPDGRLGDRYHEWQKPIELAERLIRHTTNEGASVIDPFCCTGTFLLAAAKLNRNANGCDISKENLEIAVKRGCVYAG